MSYFSYPMKLNFYFPEISLQDNLDFKFQLFVASAE